MTTPELDIICQKGQRYWVQVLIWYEAALNQIAGFKQTKISAMLAMLTAVGRLAARGSCPR
jgi:hypothetical protein